MFITRSWSVTGLQRDNPDFNRTSIYLTFIDTKVLNTDMSDNEDEVSITRIMFHRYSAVWSKLMASYSKNMEIFLSDPTNSVMTKVVNLTV